MINVDKRLKSIRQRDAECGDDIPEHWTAQLDRRYLLQLLDNALWELDKYENYSY